MYSPPLLQLLRLVPLWVVRKGELWRLWTFGLCGGGGLSGLFSAGFSVIILGAGIGTRLERAVGSLRLCLLTALASAIAAFLFVLAALACDALWPASGAMLWAARGGGGWALSRDGRTPSTSSCRMSASQPSRSPSEGEVRPKSPCTNSLTYVPA